MNSTTILTDVTRDEDDAGAEPVRELSQEEAAAIAGGPQIQNNSP